MKSTYVTTAATLQFLNKMSPKHIAYIMDAL